MANYNSIRTAEAQPIGSCVPWVGPLTQTPAGWIICNGQELQGSDYPLLARIIQTAYGGTLSGDFPNFDGTFVLPNIGQKALADISTEYFTSNEVGPGPSQQPTIGIDTPESLNVVAQFIGPEGDLGTPGTTFAVTDLNFTYEPDPDGTVLNVRLDSGLAPNTSVPVFYQNVPAVPNPFPTINDVSTGQEVFFNVIQNTDNTYQISVSGKGFGYEVNDELIILGSNISNGTVPGVDGVNDIFITVLKTGNPFFSGTVDLDGEGNALEFVPGFGIATVNVVPRKLGRKHFPSHIHPGVYTTINKTDSTTRPGRGVGVFANPEITINEYYFGLYDDPLGSLGGPVYQGNSLLDVGNIWQNSESGEITDIGNPYGGLQGRYAIGSVAGTKPPKTHQPFNTATAAHGIGRSWFTNAKKLRDGNANVSPTNAPLEKLRTTGKLDVTSTLPFADQTTQVNGTNYDDGVNGSDLVQGFTKTLFNSAANSFTVLTPTYATVNDVIEAHNHQGEFNITFDNGSLRIPPTLSVLVNPENVVPDNLPNAFQMEVDASSPSLSCLTLIRAY